MNSTVGQKIHARKIALSYFYANCFFKNLGANDRILEQLAAQDRFLSGEWRETAQTELRQKLENFLTDDAHELLTTFAENFFGKREKTDIDFDFLFKICSSFSTRHAETAEQVNKFAKTFPFEQMDTIDQALFVLGRSEHKNAGTVREIILNELVELAKRYGDDGSTKLVNGIMHQVLAAATDEWSKPQN